MGDMPPRIQRQRIKGWRMPEGAVFVGRPTLWGNPWIPGSPGRVRLGEANFPLNIEGTLEHDLTAAQAVELYRQLVMTIAHQEAWSLPARLNDRGLYYARIWLRTRRAAVSPVVV